jgi:ABC-type nitrate/sulfonate/bicarbonate transport system permease component
VAVLFLVWHFLTTVGHVRPIFLPSISATFVALWLLLKSGIFAHALAISFARITAATILAAIAGSILGVLMGVSKTAEHILSPITQPLRYLPITALLPLLILWLGIGENMKVTFLFIGIVFYFIPLVRNAIRSVPEEFTEVARSFNASRSRLIREVYWPHALPKIFDGLIVINAIGWTYVILAEIVNAQDGLGYLVYIAGRLQRSDEVFASLILIGAVAIASDRILHYVRGRYFFW